MKKVFLVIIFVLFLVSVKNRFVDYNKKVYEWHCEKIYPFHLKLSKTEQGYIKKCMEISYYELLRPFFMIFNPFIRRLSYFTFSHKVTNGKINSGRIAYGSVINHLEAYKYSLEVLREKQIICEITPGKNILFGGLGWDIENNYFKVYFRFNDYRKIPDTFKKLLPDMSHSHTSGIISITYGKNNKIVERKVYYYPKNELVAKLVSDKRKETQVDINSSIHKYKKQVGEQGKKLLELYEKNGYSLDTMTYKNKMNYTFYFPVVG